MNNKSSNRLSILKNISLFKERVSEETDKIISDFLKSKIISHNDNKYKFNSNYKVGEVLYKKGMYFLRVHSNITSKDIVIKEDSNFTARNGDFVLTKRKITTRGQVELNVIEILQKSLKTEVIIYKDGKYISFKDQTIYGDLGLGLDNNTIVSYNFENKTHELIGNLEDAKIDKKLSLKLFDKKEFDYSDCDDELLKIEKDFDRFFESEVARRKDLSNLDFCTIDPKGAKDHDDALFYNHETKTLYIAIADVSSYVVEGSAIDIQARQRAFSIYFPNSNIPMLPPLLSENYCSLRPFEKRLAYVFRLTLDEKLNVKKSKLYEAVIEVKKKYTYKQVDEFLSKPIKKLRSINESDKKVIRRLKPLFELTSRLRKKRLNYGLDFDNSDTRLNLDANEQIQSISLESSSPSHSLVEECMLLANQASAKIVREGHNDKGIYRVHARPEYNKLVELVDSLKTLDFDVNFSSALNLFISNIQQEASNHDFKSQVDKLIIQSQKQASYQSSVGEHFGLGFEHYSHFTSPIRRYSDLILHRILKTSNLPANLEEECDDISSKEREISKLDFDYRDRKFARWASQNIDKSFEAMIVSVDEEHLKAELCNEFGGIRVSLDNILDFKLFDKVQIKILDSDIITKDIRGMIV
jgi:ribonuclease R